MIFLLLAVNLCGLPQDRLESQERHAFELTAADPKREGFGPSRTFRYELTSPWTFVSIHAESDPLDLMLQVDLPEGSQGRFVPTDPPQRHFEDDDGSGAGNPEMLIAIQSGGELIITVNAKPPDAVGSASVRIVESIETEATNAAAAAAGQVQIEARQLVAAGDADAARARLREGFEALRELAGPNNSLMVHLQLENFAWELKALGDLGTAREAFLEFFQYQTRVLPRNSEPILSIALQIAAIDYDHGRIREAHDRIRDAIVAHAQHRPENDLSLLNAQSGLGGMLALLGSLQEARALLERVVEQLESILPNDHPELIRARANLATALTLMGDERSARGLLEEALAVFSATQPEESPDLQTARLNLAANLKRSGEFDVALSLEERVVKVYERIYPAEHPSLLLARLNLAATLKGLGDTTTARMIQEDVLKKQLATLTPDHPEIQLARLNLSLSLQSLGERQRARELQETVLAVYRNRRAFDSSSRQWAEMALAVNLFELGEIESGREHVRLLARSIRAAAERFGGRSERELDLLGQALGNEIRVALTLSQVGDRDSGHEETEREVFSMAETIRSGPNTAARLARALRSDESAAQLLKSIQIASREVSRLASSAESAESGEFARALRERDRLERELVDRVSTTTSVGPATWRPQPEVEAIAARMGPAEAGIAFWRYSPYQVEIEGERLDEKPRYLAWVVRPGQPLKRLELGPAESIDSLITSWRAALADPSGSPMAELLGESLRQRVLDPLRPELGEAKRLWIVSAGSLHGVPIDALPLGDTVLGDQLEVVHLSSLSELTLDRAPFRSTPSLLAMGGIAYDLSAATSPVKPRSEGGAAVALLRSGSASTSTGSFPTLGATENETLAIGAAFREAFPDAVQHLLLGSDADRSSFETLAPSARFIHLATHTWYAPEGISRPDARRTVDEVLGLESSTSLRDQVQGLAPALLCGIAFAGANGAPDSYGRVWGVMTGEELRALDLTACELAVLSACESNVGQQLESQRIASLQQSLHAAGARTAITSLWKVPDEPTQVLMSELYRRLWIEGDSKAEALWNAKRSLRDRVDESGRPAYRTRDWAGWVLSGDPD